VSEHNITCFSSSLQAWLGWFQQVAPAHVVFISETPVHLG